MADQRWVRRRFRVPDPSVEAFAEALWFDRPLGVELRPGGVDVYYDENDLPAAPSERSGVELLAEEIVVAEDWLAGWRSSTAPFALGDRFWIDPREENAGERETAAGAAVDRITLRLPARRAFGTGSHATTRLAVSWLETIPLRGRDVLDVGAGTGILGFVARSLGARRVVGVERELESALLAGENRRLNRVDASIVAGTSSALASAVASDSEPVAALRATPSARGFDVIVANLLSAHLRPELSSLAARLRPDGDFVYAGALTVERREIVADFAAVGLEPVAETIDGEWSSWRLQGSGA